MTHVFVNRALSSNWKQHMEKGNYHYARGLEELRRRRPGGITPEQFEQIRSFSRQSWKSECEEQDAFKSRFETTYLAYHQFRKESSNEGEKYRARSRPTSPTRKNNPHPPRQFITLHIKEAPGFQYKKESPTSTPYRVGKRYEKEEIFDDKKLYYSTPTHDELKRWEMKNIKSGDVNVSLHRWLKETGIEEEEKCKLLKKKLSREHKLLPEVNSKYIGRLNPDRYVLGKY